MDVLVTCVILLVIYNPVLSQDTYNNSFTITLAPPNKPNATQVGLIIIPGDSINAGYYILFGQKLQSLSYHSTWIGIVGGVASDDPEGGKSAILDGIDKMRDSGMNTSHLIIYLHSRPDYTVEWITEFVETRTNIEGIILGGCHTPEGYLTTRILPTLYLQGDLDGVVPVMASSHIGEELRSLVDEDSLYKTIRPVVIMEDINHAGYIGVNITLDIQSPLIWNISAERVSEHMNNFLVIVTNTPEEMVPEVQEVFIDEYENTMEFYKPIWNIKAATLDNDRSLWAEIGQQIISAVSQEQLDYLLISNHVVEMDELVNARPEVHQVEEKANVSVFTSIAISEDDSHYTEQEVTVKYKRSEAIQEVLKPIGVEFGNLTSCKDVNQQAIDSVLLESSELALERFYSSGRQFILLEDDVKLTGSGWVNSHIMYNYTTEGLYIRSPSLVTGINIGLGIDGMHYCKLLPPTKAMEYIVTDSLRKLN